MSAYFPGQKQTSFSLFQLSTFTQPLEQYNFSHSWISPSWSFMKAAVSVLEPFPPLDGEEERGRERRQKGQGQLRAEERGSQPELSDFFCSLFPLQRGSVPASLGGKYRSLSNSPEELLHSRKKQPKVLLWLIKIKGCIAPTA